MLTIARYVKQLMNWLGWLVASLSLVVVILQSLLVFNRYLYAQNMYFGKFIRFYDEWLMVGFSALFMLGSAFAFNRDAHVRVDIVYAGLNPRGKHSINFMGVLLFLVPMCAVIFFFSLNSLGRELNVVDYLEYRATTNASLMSADKSARDADDVAVVEQLANVPIERTAAAAMIFVKAPIWTSFYESLHDVRRMRRSDNTLRLNSI